MESSPKGRLEIKAKKPNTRQPVPTQIQIAPTKADNNIGIKCSHQSKRMWAKLGRDNMNQRNDTIVAIAPSVQSNSSLRNN